MSERKQRSLLRWAALVLLLLPALYLLSYGPFLWMCEHEVISRENGIWLAQTIYSPMMWLGYKSETFGRIMGWYIQFWFD